MEIKRECLIIIMLWLRWRHQWVMPCYYIIIPVCVALGLSWESIPTCSKSQTGGRCPHNVRQKGTKTSRCIRTIYGWHERMNFRDFWNRLQFLAAARQSGSQPTGSGSCDWKGGGGVTGKVSELVVIAWWAQIKFCQEWIRRWVTLMNGRLWRTGRWGHNSLIFMTKVLLLSRAGKSWGCP